MSESESNTLPLSLKKKPISEFTGPGSTYKVIEQYKKSQYNASGQNPVFIKPDDPEKKNKNRIN